MTVAALAGGDYQDEETAAEVMAAAELLLQIVKRPDSAKCFAVIGTRWIIERTFG